MKTVISITFIIFMGYTAAVAQIAVQDAKTLTRYIIDNNLSIDNFESPNEIAYKNERFSLDTITRKLSKADSIKISQRTMELIDLISKIEKQQGDTILTILEHYFPGISKSSDENSITETLKSNHFLKDITCGRIRSEDRSSLISLSGIASSVGGLDVTSIADGLAKFLVKRTKEELNVAFFSKFREVLNDNKYRDLKILFPNTWALLDAIGDEIYNYNKYLQSLREAFQADIKVLDETLPGIIPSHQEFFNDHFEFAAGLKSGCYITKSLRMRMHPGEILDNYPMDYLIKPNEKDFFNKNFSGAIQTLQLFSESIRDTLTSEDHYWVNIKTVKELVKDKQTFRIYLGLIYQVAKSDRFKGIHYETGSLVDLMDQMNFGTDYDAYKNFIISFSLKADNLAAMIRNYSKPGSDSIAFENYARYFRTSVDMIEYCTVVCDLPHFKDIIKVNLHTELKNYFTIAYETSDLATDINRRNYASAINHAVAIYNLVNTKPLTEYYDLTFGKSISKGDKKTSESKIERAEARYNRAFENYLVTLNKDPLPEHVTIKIDTTRGKMNSADATTGIKEATDLISMKNLKDSVVCSRETIQKLAKYGSFISTMVVAKNSDEVEQAIEAAALPSGSSRIKRESAMNVSLNAYTGLFMAHEKIPGVKDDLLINNYGVAVPVGTALSFGVHHWSLSLFVSVIDIGALASFRFVASNDSVSQVPTIQLKDILSPGLFFSIGIPKCPLSVNLGAQIGPNLRKVYVEDPNKKGTYINAYQDNIYLRFSASLVVDIPIFNFYTRTKN